MIRKIKLLIICLLLSMWVSGGCFGEVNAKAALNTSKEVKAEADQETSKEAETEADQETSKEVKTEADQESSKEAKSEINQEASKEVNTEISQAALEEDKYQIYKPTSNFFNELGLYFGITSLVDTVDAVKTTRCGENEYLFLPSYTDLSKLVFNFDKNTILVATYKDNSAQIENGKPFDVTDFVTKPYSDGSVAFYFTAYQQGVPKEYELRIMKSENIAAMFIISDDPSQKGMEYTAAYKENKAKGQMNLVDGRGVPVYLGGLSQIKTRGNSTWNCVKKPYQIKLDKASDLIETGDEKNKAKTWILLADAFDPTLIRNSLAYEFAKDMGIDAPDGRFVDLYYDGYYVGNYYLCEKVESGAGRVPIDDNGYLLEMDIIYGQQEDQYFTDLAGNTFVIKEPEDLSDERIKGIENYMNAALLAANMGGIDPATGLSVWDYIDIDSLAKYYVFLENTGNPDLFLSSAFFYLPSGGKLISGPAWDFDSSFGLSEEAGTNKTYGLTQNISWIGCFLGNAEFKKALRKYEIQASKLMNNMAYSGVEETADIIQASQEMNEVLWQDYDFNKYHKESNYSRDIYYLKNYISGRSAWLLNNLGK